MVVYYTELGQMQKMFKSVQVTELDLIILFKDISKESKSHLVLWGPGGRHRNMVNMGREWEGGRGGAYSILP